MTDNITYHLSDAQNQTAGAFYSGPGLQTGFPFKREFQISFSSIQATVLLDAADADIKVTVFSVTPTAMWRSEFKSGYLEEICRKTGNELTYLQFVTVLQQAFESASMEVFVDLLNLQDLQMLKGSSKQTPQKEQEDIMTKRYLILTILKGDKKYHYPMPLSPVEISNLRLLDKDTAKFMIKQMSNKLTQPVQAMKTAQSFFSSENPHNP